MNLDNWLKKSLLSGILRFLPLAVLASLTDAAVLWGIRSFMQLLNNEAPFTLWEWIILMVALAILRFLFLFWKTKQSDSFLFNTGTWITSWFMRTVRDLSPSLFHTPNGDSMVEAAYDSTQILQNNGNVFFQAIQAILQLAIFFPVLLYISWPLTLFLFAIVVPLVGLMQRKLHAMGPEEETLLFLRSKFRTDINMARRLYRNWSCNYERTTVSSKLQSDVRKLNTRTLNASIRKNGLSLATETISVLSMVAVLAFCALLITKGWMDSTGLVLYCSAVLLSYKPIKECTRIMPQFRSAMSAFNLLVKFNKLPSKNLCIKANGENLQINNGHFKYTNNQNVVFEKLNLFLSEKKPVLLRGKNGSGKSTLLKLIAGLEEWQGGDSLLMGKAKKAGIFFMAQDLELPPREMLNFLLMRNADPAIQDFIKAGNIEKLLSKPGLSGGERAKVALTWALASKAAVVLLDEPFSAVALADRETLLQQFLDASQKMNKWVVIASHDIISTNLIQQFQTVEMENVKN